MLCLPNCSMPKNMFVHLKLSSRSTHAGQNQTKNTRSSINKLFSQIIQKLLMSLNALVIMHLFELAKMSMSGIGIKKISLLIHFLMQNTQDISFAGKLVKLCNNNQKQSRRLLNSATPRLHASTHPALPYHGKRSLTTPSLESLISFSTRGMISAPCLGLNQPIRRQLSNSSSSVRSRRS